MKSKLIVALVVAAGAASFAAVAASPPGKDLTQVEKIIDRAIGLMAAARDYSVRSDEIRVATMLNTSEQTVVRTSQLRSFGEPGILWSDSMSSQGSTGVSWSDGKVLRQFSASANNKDPDRRISERPLLEGEYIVLGGHRFNLLSPLKSEVFDMLMTADRDGRFAGGKYLGRQRLHSDECDVIETRWDMPESYWSQTRANYPQVPEKGARQIKMYLRVPDGRLMRLEETDWSMTDIDGEPPAPPHFNMRIERRADYRYGPALPAQETDLARFNAAVRSANGGKLPQIEHQADEWLGKPLPAIELATLDGKAVRWEDFRGKVLVVETWFIDCTYCKYAFPYYEKRRRELADRNVVFMAFNTGDQETNGAAQIKEWLKKSREGAGFLWVRSGESEQAIGEKLKFPGAPLFFVVGTDGKVVASYRGFNYGNGGEDPRLSVALRKAGVRD